MALSSYARRKVYERDHGVCALCGCDADKASRILWWLSCQRGNLDARDAHNLLGLAWGMPGSPWEADHIVPLAEGGSNDLSNYRTLCRSCHKGETKALAGRLAAARRGTP